MSSTSSARRDTNTTSYHLLRAEEKAFFEVPDVIVLDTLDGEVQVPVSFAKIVKRQPARRGVVQIEPRAKKAADDDNISPTEDAATKKGDAMWKDYLKSLCQEWYTIVSEIKRQAARRGRRRDFSNARSRLSTWKTPAGLLWRG